MEVDFAFEMHQGYIVFRRMNVNLEYHRWLFLLPDFASSVGLKNAVDAALIFLFRKYTRKAKSQNAKMTALCYAL
jgi:hypothetical protein